MRPSSRLLLRPALVLLPASALLLAAPDRAVTAAGREAGASSPILVELFTSQGCSSCPPADRLLAALAAEPAAERAVVPIAFHVDYWNRLGWRDPFSSRGWSQRQHAYARAFRADTVYTPQAVVAGRAHCNGADRAALQRLVSAALREPPGAWVRLRLSAAGGEAMRAEVTAGRHGQGAVAPAEVIVALYQDGLVTAVARGENARRSLRNERVVRRLARAATLPAAGSTRASVSFPIDEDWPRTSLGAVAFVQETASLRVLAAAEARP